MISIFRLRFLRSVAGSVVLCTVAEGLRAVEPVCVLGNWVISFYVSSCEVFEPSRHFLSPTCWP